MSNVFSPAEVAEIQELFGRAPEQLDPEILKKTLRELRAKYHPDNFEKFGDDTVQQLATERFQRIERLAEKIEAWLAGNLQPGPTRPAQPPADAFLDPRALFAYRAMKIEIRTGDKDLKFHLFGTFYRWLTLGEQFKIPGARGAFLIADEEHVGHKIGFRETIRVYLTFEENDPLDVVVDWLFGKIAGRADALLVEGEVIPIEREAILTAVKRRSFRALAAGAG